LVGEIERLCVPVIVAVIVRDRESDDDTVAMTVPEIDAVVLFVRDP